MYVVYANMTTIVLQSDVCAREAEWSIFNGYTTLELYRAVEAAVLPEQA
jgi:hypothetical protein